MNKDSIILIWTTIITVVLLVWIRMNPPYLSDTSVTVKPFDRVEVTKNDVESLKNLSR